MLAHTLNPTSELMAAVRAVSISGRDVVEAESQKSSDLMSTLKKRKTEEEAIEEEGFGGLPYQAYREQAASLPLQNMLGFHRVGQSR